VHHNTVKSILSNDDELNIGELAEAHANAPAEKRPTSRTNSLNAWAKLKTKEKDEEAWRRKIQAAWDKKHT
jgi:hypothetical protein